MTEALDDTRVEESSRYMQVRMEGHNEVDPMESTIIHHIYLTP